MGITFYELFCIPAFFVLFRETLEAAVLIQVIIQYLHRKGESYFVRQVWIGAAVGSFLSFLFMVIVLSLFFFGQSKLGGFAEMLVEGTMLGVASIIIAYFLVTHLAPGMKQKGTWSRKWERKMDDLVEQELQNREENRYGFFFLSFSSVIREGFEAAVFVVGIGAAFPASSLPLAIVAGVIVGLLFGLAMFGGTKDLDLSTFFIVSAIFLAFVAAGLASHASYEYQKGDLFGAWSCDRKCDQFMTMVSSEYPELASYQPVSGIEPHSLIGADVADISAALKTGDWDSAWEIYDEGSNSVKSVDEVTGLPTLMRTLRGFSKSLEGEATFDTFASFHGGNALYADDYVRAVLWDRLSADSTAKSAARPEGGLSVPASIELTDAMVSQLVVKTIQYQHTWIYSTHELYSALGKCAAGNIDRASGAPHAWDEGWAFWAGDAVGESGRDAGNLGYTLADKRCADFATCVGDEATLPAWRDGDTDANSNVNAKLLRLYRAGQTAVIEGRCDDAREQYLDLIVAQMVVPLIQGAIKYAYLSDEQGGDATVGDDGKAFSEFKAFADAALPMIASCDADAAALIQRNAAIPATGPLHSSVVPDGHAAVADAFESVYVCLGISCADVGGGYAGRPACADSVGDETAFWTEVTDAALVVEEECEDDDDGGWHTYRRLETFDFEEHRTGRQLKTARQSTCDGKGQQIAWVNQEVWDITGCCDTDNHFFFLLMVLFWYRPAATNLEVIVYCGFWAWLLAWGWIKVNSIKEFNAELEQEVRDKQDDVEDNDDKLALKESEEKKDEA